MTTRGVYREPETVPEGTSHGESETNPVSDYQRDPASSSQPPSEPAQTETTHTHTRVKRLRLQGKQSQVQSDGRSQTQTQNRESSVTTHVPSQPMELSDVPARVRLNLKRSPLESQCDRSKQRRVMEDPDEDEVMIGEVQVNKEVEHPASEVSVTEFDDWQQELQSQNDFMKFHGVPGSEVANKEVIKNSLGAETTRRRCQGKVRDETFQRGKTKTMISMQEHQLQCRSIWYWLWQQNASHSESRAQSRVSIFPLRFFMRR